MLDSRVQKIQLYKELDVDFGSLFPEEVEGYISTVLSKRHTYFEFLLILPKLEDDIVFNEIVDDVMLIFFEKGSKYKIRRVTNEEIEIYKKNKYFTPILSFDPYTVLNDKLGFFWLVPPKHLRQ